MSKWRDKQEKEFRTMIDTMVNETYMKCRYPDRPKKIAWIRWCTDYICRRFQYLEKPNEWIPTLAQFDDENLFFREESVMAVKYLRMIRDYARRYVN